MYLGRKVLYQVRYQHWSFKVFLSTLGSWLAFEGGDTVISRLTAIGQIAVPPTLTLSAQLPRQADRYPFWARRDSILGSRR